MAQNPKLQQTKKVNKASKRYSDIYKSYISAHTSFDLRLYNQYMAKKPGRLGIVQRLGKGVDKMTKQELQSALRTNPDMQNISNDVLKKFNENWGMIGTKSAVQKNFSDLNSLLAQFQNLVTEIRSMIDLIGGTKTGLDTAVSKLEHRINAVRVKNILNKDKGFVQFYAPSGATSVNSFNTGLQYGENGKVIRQKNGHTVVDMPSLALFLRSNIQKLYKLFLEEVAVSEFGDGATLGAKAVFDQALKANFADFSSNHLGSIRSSFSASEIGVDLKWYREGDEAPTSYYAGAGSPLADFTITYRVNPRGGGASVQLEANEKISGSLGLARVSQKMYDSLKGGKPGWIKGVDRVLGAYILNSGQGDPRLIWGLIRSFAFPPSWGEANNLINNSLAKDAFLRQYAFDAIFGSGHDYITDFFINDSFYSGQYVARKLFAKINAGESNKILKGTFNGSVSVPLDDDEKGKIGSVNSTIENIWIDPSVATQILKTKFIIEWKIGQETFLLD